MYRITGGDLKLRYEFIDYIKYFLECIVLNMSVKDYYNIDKANIRIKQKNNTFGPKLRNKSYLSNGTLVDVFSLKYELQKFINDLTLEENGNDIYPVSAISKLISTEYKYIIHHAIENNRKNKTILFLIDIDFEISNVTDINITNLTTIELFALAHNLSNDIEAKYGTFL